jgi:hypothetical protein
MLSAVPGGGEFFSVLPTPFFDEAGRSPWQLPVDGHAVVDSDAGFRVPYWAWKCGGPWPPKYRVIRMP